MPMICRVTKFRTSDNQEFDTEAEAKAHETQNDALKELGDLLRTTMNTGRMDAVLRHILVDNDAVRKILSKYQKRQPKPKPEQQKQAA
jgi:hypothetical protein